MQVGRVGGRCHAEVGYVPCTHAAMQNVIRVMLHADGAAGTPRGPSFVEKATSKAMTAGVPLVYK